MKKLAAQLLLAGAAIAATGIPFMLSNKLHAGESAKEQAKKTFDTINQAYYEKGDVNAMMRNMASDASLTIIGVDDGSFYTGYATVKNALKKAAEVRAYKCKTTEQSVTVNKSSDVAWIAQKSDCSLTTGGKTSSVTMRSTAVEVKKDGKWLLIQAHHSIGTSAK